LGPVASTVSLACPEITGGVVSCTLMVKVAVLVLPAASLTLGSGHDNITSGAGSGGDSFTLDGSFASLILQGSNNSVLVNGGSTTIWDTVGGTDALHLEIGPRGGSVGITNFSATDGVLALVAAMASNLGWTTPGQIDAAVTSDHHGGSLLSLGSQGSVDFAGVAPSSLHASNFKIV
jgi:hypothetical protein